MGTNNVACSGDDEQARSKGTTDGGATGEFTSMLAEAQKMFSTISNSNPNSGSLENSVAIAPAAGAEVQSDDEEDDFLPQPPVALYKPAHQALSSPPLQARAPAAESADSALAQNWLRVAGTQQTPAKVAEKPAGEDAASTTLFFHTCLYFPYHTSLLVFCFCTFPVSSFDYLGS